MNKHRHRIIFNQLRGLMMVVAECVKSHSAAAEPSAANGSGTSALTLSQGAATNQTAASVALRPLAFSLMCALGLVTVIPNPLNLNQAHAEAIAAGNVPGNQRPTVLNAPNGVEVVNIQTPSAAGVSHNVYSILNVPEQGMIFNNSRSNVQTELGGWTQGNPWLATGSARIILNEINSSNPSYLNGYMEVAGSRAELIIANPNGISCNGCGFINASRGVLTTGTPILSGGDLTGYRVTGGTVNIWGNGLDASRSNYTDIIARAVEVNAGIWANDLKITTGANTVNAANTQTSAVAASGGAPASGFALDVAALGGMYAGKITLIGTEAGLGVRNAGVINAAAGNLTLSTDGRLENAGSIIGNGDVAVAASATIANSGTLYAQGNTSLSTQGDIDNSGLIAAQGNTDLVANGANSHISNTANTVLAAGLKADGTLTTSGNLNLSATQSITALGQNLSAGDQTLTAKQLDISGSNTFAANLTLVATNGDIQAQNATISANQALTASTIQSLITDAATVSANQLNLTAHDLSNVGGELVQTGAGDTTISLAGDLNNDQGRIATNSNNLTLAAQTLTNTGGSIEHAGPGTLDITSTSFNGNAGQIISNGALDLTAATANLNNGSTIAKRINVDTATLSNRNGEIIQTGSDATSIHASISLDNTDGIVAGNGPITLTVGDLINQGGTIQAAGTSNLTVNATGAIDNTSLNSVTGNINAGGTAIITADSLNNTQGQITAGDTLTISTTSNSSVLQNTQGLIAANQALTLNAASVNNSSGTIASVHNDVTITANVGSINNSAGQISAAQNLSTSSYGLNNTAGSVSANNASINTQLQTLDNTGGSIIASAGITPADLDLQTGALINDNGLIQSGGNLTVNTHGQTLTNSNSGGSKGILALGSSTFITGDLNNQTGYIGTQGAITANSAAINNSSGSITGEASLTINGSSLDNQAGRIEALGNVDIGTTTNIDNRSGLLRSGQTLTLITASVDNRNTQGTDQGIEGASVSISADQIDNTGGAIRADNALAITGSGSLNNSSGLISSASTLTIADRLASANSNVNTKTLVVTDTGGTIIAGNNLNIDSQSLTGDGKVLSHSDLTTKLTTDYTHSGEWQADGNATFTTTGSITNQTKLLAGGNASTTLSTGTLDITAANLDNQATGEIAGANLNIHVANTLTNRGLLDGGDTFIHTNMLNNIGTGRIYGDHVAIATGTLTNAEETMIDPVTGIGVTQAAVIAARDRLDIGAQAITNREHALLFSAGDMAIGGSLDANHQATVAAGQPQAAVLNNNSATIEAMANLSLNVAAINNTNLHLTTQMVMVGSEVLSLYQPSGYGQYQPDQVYLTWDKAPGAIYYPPASGGLAYMAGNCFFCDNSNNYVHLNLPGVTSTVYFYVYDFTRTTSETQLVTTDPGKILAGGNMQLAASSLYNQDSQIIAGVSLTANVNTFNNAETTGQQVISDVGQQYYIHVDRKHDDSDVSTYNYTPAPIIKSIALGTTIYRGGGGFTGTGTQVAALNTGSVSQMTTGANNVNVAVVTAPNQGGNTQLAPVITNTQTGASTIVRSVTPNTSLPNNSLYHTNPNPAGSYYVETDPRFANYRNWLSSDYMLKALSYDPATITKRLGDGFYEQRLIREQIAQLTGRRFLTGYTNDEEAYRALMTNGITFAQTYQLIPGVALSEAQIAQLTSDIVWLVETTITLADGTTVQALVPQVYVRLQPGDINGQGTLLAGDSINLKLSGDPATGAGGTLVNSGSIAGRTAVSLTADNIHNLGGRISGNNTQLSAHNDINNLGGSIHGNDSLSLNAGHDINIMSTTQSNASQNGLSNFSRTNLDRIAGLYVDNPNGILVASSGNDINLQGAMISNSGGSNSGTNGITVLDAGHDLNLTTITTAEQNNTVKNSKNYIKHDSTQEIGTVIQTDGDLILNAGNNVSARAAEVTSDNGNLTVNAGNDIRIEAGVSTHSDQAASYKKSSGFLSSRKTTTRDSASSSEVLSSTFSGNTVNLNAGNDITISGSNVVGTQDVNLNAGNNINIEAAQATHDETHYYKEKKSGFSASSSSISYGTSKLSTTNNTQTVTNIGSTVGSVEGDVNINSGKQYTQTASDVLTPQGDINISAQNVDINSAMDTYANQQTMKYKQSGITLSISNPVISAAQTVNQMQEASKQTNDPRMQALAAGTSALAINNAANAINSVDQFGNIATAGSTGANDLTHLTEANAADKVGGINISLSIGTSKSSSSSQQTINTVRSSILNAGGDINITATGDTEQAYNANSGNINVIGSTIKAQDDITLTAQNDINLQAAANTSKLDSKNKSSSASIGVSVNLGANAGVGITAGISSGKGKATGNGTSWTETQVQGGNQQGDSVTLNSGANTSLIGAQVSGDQVQANVGTSGTGNLNIVSLQDTDQYKDKQSNNGISVTVPVTGTNWGGSISSSNSKTNSNYQSVNEQAGIYAGDGGFQITTQGNTNLTGAVIASTEPAIQNNANSLTTQTLTTSNIENSAAYEAEGHAATIGAGKQAGLPQLSGLGVGHDAGDADSVTVSAISQGKVNVTNSTTQQTLTGKDSQLTVATLNRDVHVNEKGEAVDSQGNSTAGTIAPIFDKEKVQKEINAQMQITQAFDKEQQQFRIELNKMVDVEQAKKAAIADMLKNQDLSEAQRADLINKGVDAQKEIERLENMAIIFSTVAGGLSAPTNSIGGIVANTLAPEAANQIGQYFKDHGTEGSVTQILAHGVLAGAVGALGGNNPLGAALSAMGGETLAPLVADLLYGKSSEQLNAEQKAIVSSIARLGGIASAVSIDSSANNIAQANLSAQNAVDNNWGVVGHYSTMATVLYLAGFSPKDAKAIALAAWGPDTDKRNAMSTNSLSSSNNNQETIHLLDSQDDKEKVIATQQQLAEQVRVILLTIKQYENDPAKKAAYLTTPNVQNTLHAFGDSFAHVDEDGTHYSSGRGHAVDSKYNNGINDPDNPQTHPDAYKSFVNTLFSVASQVTVIPRVSDSTITSLVNKVIVSDENKQASVLNNAIGSVNSATSSSLVNSPVNDCGYGSGCSKKSVGSQVNPKINSIYGIRK